MLEVCASNLASALAAEQAGAGRIELCSALSVGGLTPSYGMTQHVFTTTRLQVMVLIRLREGNFVYTDRELQVMEQDIQALRSMCTGFVFGALTPEGDIDLPAMQRLMQAAQGMPVTFHRAFDRCRDPFLALEQIIGLGCCRILTSGQQQSAAQGIDLLRQLRERAAGRIIIMPGGGVTPDNAADILAGTGCSEIHASCSAGTGITDPAAVRQILATFSTE